MPDDPDAAKDDAAYFENVYKAFRDDYLQYHLSANHSRRMNYLTLPRDQKLLLQEIGFKGKLDAVDQAIRRKAEFLELIADSSQSPFLQNDSDEASEPDSPTITDDPDFLETKPDMQDVKPDIQVAKSDIHETKPSIQDRKPNLPETKPYIIETKPDIHSHDHDHGHSHSHAGHAQPPLLGKRTSSSGAGKGSKASAKQQAEKDQTQDKVRSTLRQMVRDWSIEGKPERDACYQPCLDALEAEFQNVPAELRSGVRVLVPGAGLGRLPLEIAAKGFASQGNEFSAHMLIASNWCLNRSSAARPFVIQPYVHSFSNHSSTADSLLLPISIPDVTPSALLSRNADFSFVAGDFLEVYGGLRSNGSWGTAEGGDNWSAVVTVFFVDTARNILNYLKVIWQILEPGGVWINNGPLLWHFENSPVDQQGQGSIELSLDELKQLARTIGFEISDEKTLKTTYAGFEGSMLRSEYQSAFFVARKPKITKTEQK